MGLSRDWNPGTVAFRLLVVLWAPVFECGAIGVEKRGRDRLGCVCHLQLTCGLCGDAGGMWRGHCGILTPSCVLWVGAAPWGRGVGSAEGVHFLPGGWLAASPPQAHCAASQNQERAPRVGWAVCLLALLFGSLGVGFCLLPASLARAPSSTAEFSCLKS